MKVVKELRRELNTIDKADKAVAKEIRNDAKILFEGGIDFSEFELNPVVIWGSRSELPVGPVEEIQSDMGAVLLKLTDPAFDAITAHPDAYHIGVGFRVDEFDETVIDGKNVRVIKSAKLMDVGIYPYPAEK